MEVCSHLELDHAIKQFDGQPLRAVLPAPSAAGIARRTRQRCPPGSGRRGRAGPQLSRRWRNSRTISQATAVSISWGETPILIGFPVPQCWHTRSQGLAGRPHWRQANACWTQSQNCVHACRAARQTVSGVTMITSFSSFPEQLCTLTDSILRQEKGSYRNRGERKASATRPTRRIHKARRSQQLYKTQPIRACMAKARGRPTGGRETGLLTRSFATQGSIRWFPFGGLAISRGDPWLCVPTSRSVCPYRGTLPEFRGRNEEKRRAHKRLA